MKRLRKFLLTLGCAMFAFGFSAHAANTNSIVWHKTADRVDADVRGEALWPLLEQIAVSAEWHLSLIHI